MNKIDVEEVNKQLDIDDIKLIMSSFGAYPVRENEECIIFHSICHHLNFESHKPKLYFYKDSFAFQCYSCSSGGDIYWLVKERKKQLGEKCNFPQAIKYVCEKVGIKYDSNDIEKEENKDLYTWNWARKYKKKSRRDGKENTIYDKDILEYFPKVYHEDFLNDNISIETMKKFNIRFYTYRQQIVIPIYNDENEFIGIHSRNLDPELIELGYKYLPLKLLNGDEYKFNSSSVLYGLNMNRAFIQSSKEVIITEAPKGVMQLDTYGNHKGVGLFGRSLQHDKLKLLLKYGVERFVIALDKQYERQFDEDGNKTKEYEEYCKIINKMIAVIKPYAKEIIVLYDRDEECLLWYKDAPMDKGKEVWKRMYENGYKVEI